MTHSDQSKRDFHMERLLSNKFGKLFDWKPPKLYNSIGPFEPEIFERHFEKINDTLKICRETLISMSEEEFGELITIDLSIKSQSRQHWRLLQNAEIGLIIREEPVWYAGGFGHPDYAADFDYWSQAPHYTRDEALLLSVGVEPKHLPELVLNAVEAKAKHGFEHCATLKYLIRRREQFKRQFPYNHGSDKISPEQLFDWFEQINLQMPKEFTSRYLKDAKHRAPPRDEQPAKRPHKRELDMIAQLFTVMAIEYYGYRPQDTRSPTPKEIVDAAAKAGIDVSDDTVRKYLRLGASFISPDWKPDDA